MDKLVFLVCVCTGLAACYPFTTRYSAKYLHEDPGSFAKLLFLMPLAFSFRGYLDHGPMSMLLMFLFSVVFFATHYVVSSALMFAGIL